MIEHDLDCISFEDDNYCDCDFWDKLGVEQEQFNKRHFEELESQNAALVTTLEAIQSIVKDSGHRTQRTLLQTCRFFDELILPTIDHALAREGGVMAKISILDQELRLVIYDIRLALTELEDLTTAEFSLGGDKHIRDTLANAIERLSTLI